jgi:hypothetical protein
MSDVLDEAETILPKGTRYKVVKRQRMDRPNNSHLVLHLEETK